MARGQVTTVEAANFTVFAPHYEPVMFGYQLGIDNRRVFPSGAQFYEYTQKTDDRITYFGAYASFAIPSSFVVQISNTSVMDVSIPFFMTDGAAIFGQTAGAFPLLQFPEPVELLPDEQLQIMAAYPSGVDTISNAFLVFVGVRHVVVQVNPELSSEPKNLYAKNFFERQIIGNAAN